MLQRIDAGREEFNRQHEQNNAMLQQLRQEPGANHPEALAMIEQFERELSESEEKLQRDVQEIEQSQDLQEIRTMTDNQKMRIERDFHHEAESPIQEMPGKRATLEGLRALHVCTIHVPGDDMFFFDTFIALGADLNLQDEFGVAPLHLAAERYKYQVINYLISAGADPNLKTLSNKTALDCLLSSHQSALDRHSKDQPGRLALEERHAIPLLESMKASMPEHQKGLLIDGWLSPRMMKMLFTTAYSVFLIKFILRYLLH